MQIQMIATLATDSIYVISILNARHEDGKFYWKTVSK